MDFFSKKLYQIQSNKYNQNVYVGQLTQDCNIEIHDSHVERIENIVYLPFIN
jgi:hypothetical protein